MAHTEMDRIAAQGAELVSWMMAHFGFTFAEIVDMMNYSEQEIEQIRVLMQSSGQPDE